MISSGRVLTTGRICLAKLIDANEESNEMKYYHYIEND